MAVTASKFLSPAAIKMAARFLALIFIYLLVVYLVIPVAIACFVFKPAPLIDAEADPAHWGVSNAETVYFKSSDGAVLHGWWVNPQGANCGTVIIYHGRSGNISTRASVAQGLSHLGFGVLLFDYRGYGASAASAPSEQSLYADSEAAFLYAKNRVLTNANLVLGQSMGAAMATFVAAKHRVDGVILISPYRNTPELLRTYLPAWLPAPKLQWQFNRFDAQQFIALINAPLIVLASAGDRLVPIAESQALYLNAPSPMKTWLPLDYGDHNGLLQSELAQRALGGAMVRRWGCVRERLVSGAE